MSGCHDPDSLLHDLNHGLAKCFERVEKMEDEHCGRLGNLDHKIEHCYEGIEKCFYRIEKLENELKENSDHDERINDIENISSESRLIKLEIRLKDMREDLDNFDDKEKKLEENFNYIFKKIDKLEREIQNMGTAISIKPVYKKPYKCPVCEGTTFFESEKYYNIPDEMIKTKNICISCNGKGIVWG